MGAGLLLVEKIRSERKKIREALKGGDPFLPLL